MAAPSKPNPRTAALCPCGTGRSYSACCRPFHLRSASPATAEELMRSRYSAYAKRLPAYLLSSWHPDTRPNDIDLDPRHRWIGLTILSTEGGGIDDDVGTVGFVATFEIDRGACPRPGELRELSSFVRLGEADGRRWVYEAEVPTPR